MLMLMRTRTSVQMTSAGLVLYIHHELGSLTSSSPIRLSMIECGYVTLLPIRTHASSPVPSSDIPIHDALHSSGTVPLSLLLLVGRAGP